MTLRNDLAPPRPTSPGATCVDLAPYPAPPTGAGTRSDAPQGGLKSSPRPGEVEDDQGCLHCGSRMIEKGRCLDCGRAAR